MNTNTLLLIVIVVLLVGGGYYGRRTLVLSFSKALFGWADTDTQKGKPPWIFAAPRAKGRNSGQIKPKLAKLYLPAMGIIFSTANQYLVSVATTWNGTLYSWRQRATWILARSRL